MSELRRVIPPSRRSDRSLVVSVTVIVLFLFVAIAKPWGVPGTPRVFPSLVAGSPSSAPSHGDSVARRGLYDPALFGGKVADPAWELWPAGYVVDFGMAGPRTIRGGGSDDRSPTPAPAPSSPSVFGEAAPVHLGHADNLVVLGINTPDTVHVDAIRLWRSDDAPPRSVAGAPERVSIVSLDPPWPVDYFHVIGVAATDGSGGLGTWLPGTYRIDLLTGPGDQIRSVVASVDASGGSPSAVQAEPDRDFVPIGIDVLQGGATTAPLDTVILFEPDLRVLPKAHDLARRPGCSVGELWRAETRPRQTCSALATHDVVAVGVRLAGAHVVAMSLDELDPLDRAVTGLHFWAPEAGVGLLARADGRPLDQGTYRLVASLTGNSGQLVWYLRVGPAAELPH